MLADAARHGDEAALKIYHDCGTRLGAGVSVLIDVLNPERIVIGSIFVRCEDLIRPAMEEVISRETLIYNRKVCSVVPAELGEAIGDIAALTIGMDR